jgi:hypothetical protein
MARELASSQYRAWSGCGEAVSTMTVPNTPRPGLSKSKIAKFEQCPRRLWLAHYRPELAPGDPAAEARFAVGHEVGAIACSLVPDGVMVEADPDLAAALERTRELLVSDPRVPIFEATLEHDGVLVRIDILEPVPGGWRLIEVKSASRLKEPYYSDLASQVWVARQCGLIVLGASIRHIDTSFVLKRPGDYRGLLRDTEALEFIGELIVGREALVAQARQVLAGDMPEVVCGPQCEKPYPCEFSCFCHANLPAQPAWPVDVLCNGGGKKWRELGIEDLFAVDPAQLTNPLHQRIYAATVHDQPYHDPRGASTIINNWSCPRTWLDFETIMFAVPVWLGTSPYRQIPFQFSAHIEAPDGTVRHEEFLSLDGADPRRSCAEALCALIPGEGAVIAYWASFEREQVLALADAFPDLAAKLRSIAERIVDLHPVARQHWYHRDQRGSWSIKHVLPTVAADLDYSSLDVKDGGEAQDAYLKAICPDCTEEERKILAQQLKDYCGRDTWAMVVLARHLAGATPV